MMVVILNIDGHCNNGWHGDCHGSVSSHALQGWNLNFKMLPGLFPLVLPLFACSGRRLDAQAQITHDAGSVCNDQAWKVELS